MAVMRETQTRLQACIALAKKTHPDQASAANQQAVKACTGTASRAGACVQQADQARLDPLTPEYQQSVDACFQAAWESGQPRSQDVPPGDGSASAAAPSAPAAAARGITGCWVYNTLNLTIHDDGRVTGFSEGGKWSRIGDDRYLLTGPPSIDALTLSTDGGTLRGSNNYWGPLSAQRISGTAQSVVGAWKWPNGATTALGQDCEAQNGPLSGKWTQHPGNAIRIVWNFFFTDDVTLSSDGQSLSGKNMQGAPVGGKRVPCSK
jgi:hypothetical protein